MNSVWIWNRPKRYYLTHPWVWFQDLGYNIKYAHQRATKGYCFYDWTNFDEWFVAIVPDMLRHLADDGHSFPGSEPFETEEAWNEWLHDIADKLERCCEDCLDEETEKLQEEFNKICDEAHKAALENISPEDKKKYDKDLIAYPIEFTEEQNKVKDKYFSSLYKLQESKKETIKEVLKELGEYWYYLWD